MTDITKGMKPAINKTGLVFFIALLVIVPFLSILRVAPLSSFYLEAGALLFVLGIFIQTAWHKVLLNALPRASLYFISLALFWFVQARIMDLPYVGQSDQVVWIFIILALLAWAVRSWVHAIGKDTVVDILAFSLMVGAILQAVVCWLQFTGWATEFSGVIAYYGKNAINGQLGQRNHLGHYLTWGILATGYLWSQRKLPFGVGMAILIALTSTLGLVNSRTILLYVAAVSVLTLFWRWRTGREGNRTFFLTLCAMLMIVLVQFYLNTVLAWFADVQVETALSRVENSSFSGSARDVEWRNAWQVFLLSPVWGHGWSSFSLQGFLNSQFSQEFNPNGLSVLFTHSHNIILQLLAEMGVVGTLLVFLGAVWVVYPMFKSKQFNASSLLILSLMAVSMCHSLLEYPLWYVYFLAPFALMMSISNSERDGADGILPTSKPINYLGLLLGVVILLGLSRLIGVYYDLSQFNRQNKQDSAEVLLQKIHGLQEIARDEPLLAYYADLALTRKTSPTRPELEDWAVQASRALYYRPYSSAYQWALYQYRLGKHQEAQEWMRKLYRYYPNMVIFYGDKMRSSPYFYEFYPEWKQTCERIRAIKKDGKACLPWKS